MSTIKNHIENLNKLQFQIFENPLFSESISNHIQALNHIFDNYQASYIPQFQNIMSDVSNNFNFEINKVIDSINYQFANTFDSQLSETITNLTDNLNQLSEINLTSQIMIPYDDIDETIEIASDYINDFRNISSDINYETSEIDALSSTFSNIPRLNIKSMNIDTFLSIIGIIINLIIFFYTVFNDTANKQLEVLNKINTNVEYILENHISD